MWIVAAAFCPMCYIDDVRYLPEDTILVIERLHVPRGNNEQLL